MNIRVKAEFLRHNYILLCWKTLYNELFYRTLITHLLADGIQLVLVYKKASDKAFIEGLLKKYCIELEHITFLQYGFDSVWIRDYGPIPLVNEDGQEVHLNFQYPKQDRLVDDQFTPFFTKHFKLTSKESQLTFFGGNFTTNGQGILICTKNIFKFNTLDEASLAAVFKAELNMERCLFLEILANEQTGHADMIVKFASPTDLLVAKLPPQHPDHETMEKNISQLEKSLKGEVKIHPILIAPDNGVYTAVGTSFYSYINAIILNQSVIIPLFGEDTDEVAWNAFEKVFPDHKIKGVFCKDLIQLKGALHCMTCHA